MSNLLESQTPALQQVLGR